MIWRYIEIDLDDWIAGYVRRRYGTDARDDIDGTNAGPDSLFVARPTLDLERAIEWRPGIVPYDVSPARPGPADPPGDPSAAEP